MRELLRPRLPRLLLAVVLGVLSLGSALALAGISAWLITRAWQMPPVLDLTVAVVAVRALGISRGVLGYCQRLASHDTALRAAADTRERLYRRLADAPAEAAMRLHSGELVARIGDSVDELSDVLVRAVLPIAVAAVLGVAAVAAIAVISPAAAVVLGGLPADRGCRCAMAGRPRRRGSGSSCGAASFRARRCGDARPRACARAAGQRPPRRGHRRSREHRHRDWGRATDRAAAPAAVAAAAPTAAVGISVLGAVVAAIGIAQLGRTDDRGDPDAVAVVGVRGDLRPARRRGAAHPLTDRGAAAARPHRAGQRHADAATGHAGRARSVAPGSRSPDPAVPARPRC